MFSEMMRMRPACARNPEAAIAIDLRKSTPALLLAARRPRSTLAEGGLDEAEPAAVKRRDHLVVHLVGGDLHHLVFETDRVAGRAHLITAATVGREWGPAAGTGGAQVHRVCAHQHRRAGSRRRATDIGGHK